MGLIAVVGCGLRRNVAHLHRIHPARHLDDRGVVKRPGKLFRIDGGRGDDELQVPAPIHQVLQDAQDEIDVEAPLMGLVHDEGVVGVEPSVPLRFGQKNAVGHDLDVSVAAHLFVEPDLVSHGLPQWLAHLFGDPRGDGDGGDAPGLGHADQAVDAAAGLQAEFGDLGGFARTGLARDDDNLMVHDGRDDLVLA